MRRVSSAGRFDSSEGMSGGFSVRLILETRHLDDHLDRAGRDLRVRLAPGADLAADGDDILQVQALGGRGELGAGVLGVEDELRDPVPVAKVNEDQPGGLLSSGVDPAGELDGLALVLLAELAGGVGSRAHRRAPWVDRAGL